ncbi:MAG: HepT-like ribonuclease domain-containing protein [Candidatus Bathyarchaeia archaeon]
MRDSQVYLEDILDAINSIETYTKGLTYADFVSDRKTVDAVIRNFEIIGEATKHVPLAIRREYPNVPWKDMAGMRDKLIHGYFGVHLEVIWKTVKERLPALRVLVVEALTKMKA